MPTLRVVETWPLLGGQANDVADEDGRAFLDAARGVCELYCEELPAAGIAARGSTVRLFLHGPRRDAGPLEQDEFRVALVHRFSEGFDPGFVTVPPGFAHAEEEHRVRAGLHVVDRTLVALGGLRGWDTALLTGVRERVEARGLRFAWEGSWKASPDRRHEARGVYRIDANGQGRVQLEVRARPGGPLVERTPEFAAFPTREGLRRSARSLTWRSATRVELVPWSGPFEDVDLLGVDLGQSGTVAPRVEPDPVEPRGPLPRVVPSVLPPEPEAPTAWLQLDRVSAGLGAYGAEVSRVADLLGRDPSCAAWWATTPFRALRLRLLVHDERDGDRPAPGARRVGRDLRMTVVHDRADLPPRREVDRLRRRARDDVHAALVAVAQVRRLEPPPPLPERVGMTHAQARAARQAP